MRLRGRFGLSDIAQQIVGGFLLAGPFIVTEEVWDIAAGMSPVQTAAAAATVLLIGYGALYPAVEDRSADEESDVAGLPIRFVSLVVVAYGSVVAIALMLGAPAVFGASVSTTANAVTVSAIFSVVGASAADSLW